MYWSTVSGSDIGGREEQQDRYLTLTHGTGNHLLALADGAGGHTAGGLAAQAAIDCIRNCAEDLWSVDDPEGLLEQIIIECNEHVLRVGSGEMACTTLVLVLIKGDQIFWGHVGDSRFYILRNREIFFKTSDHSLIELQKKDSNSSTEITASSNQLYMCLGAQAHIVPEVDSGIARNGDVLLLCSDGLWGQLDMDALIADLSGKTLTDDTLRAWIQKAKISKQNHSDNITAIASRYQQKSHRTFNPFAVFASFFR